MLCSGAFKNMREILTLCLFSRLTTLTYTGRDGDDDYGSTHIGIVFVLKKCKTLFSLVMLLAILLVLL